MVEIRFHGRGGQGAVIAGKILACALFKEGKWVQSFPMFGVERRGAPVTAFTRFDEEKIFVRSNIYEPDHVVVLDQTLIQAANVTNGLKAGGCVLVNSPQAPHHFSTLDRYAVAVVDASRIALEHRLGSRSAPIVNTAILGGFARATGLVSIDAVVAAIVEEVPVHPEANASAARAAFEATAIAVDCGLVRAVGTT
ncbi:MAG: 2-oxoacid:acceptor oxidoreductase family protein [Candidatus Schekmanbacteria bacterium]|nr:2-oxoacid:acceptor oxidoreductase family protein [Candidatus Schekmanbacteria bacterium]